MARPPSSPNSSPAAARHIRSSMQHARQRTHMAPCNHPRISLECAAYRLAAGGADLDSFSIGVLCAGKRVTAMQQTKNPHPLPPERPTATRLTEHIVAYSRESRVVALQRGDGVLKSFLSGSVHDGAIAHGLAMCVGCEGLKSCNIATGNAESKTCSGSCVSAAPSFCRD